MSDSQCNLSPSWKEFYFPQVSDDLSANLLVNKSHEWAQMRKQLGGGWCMLHTLNTFFLSTVDFKFWNDSAFFKSEFKSPPAELVLLYIVRRARGFPRSHSEIEKEEEEEEKSRVQHSRLQNAACLIKQLLFKLLWHQQAVTAAALSCVKPILLQPLRPDSIQ